MSPIRPKGQGLPMLTQYIQQIRIPRGSSLAPEGYSAPDMKCDGTAKGTKHSRSATFTVG